jgi:DNA-binding response OmpR family regulator
MALILVADDDFLMREIIAEALRARGHVVGTLDDGSRVADIVTLKRPALVILDCSMPLVSGINALCRIRSSEACFDTPVLMLTGRRAVADEEIAMRAGANAYICKPFDRGELVARAEALILEAERRPEKAAVEPFVPLKAGWSAIL